LSTSEITGLLCDIMFIVVLKHCLAENTENLTQKWRLLLPCGSMWLGKELGIFANSKNSNRLDKMQSEVRGGTKERF